ncbi:DNA modification methylase [Fictibacillus halophilus]|uniref:site-specific DNA-methyltransferase (cytosine-N(4)-specific) n=1 Tax=Fictibacillus halophilus TaxID=1610490 RepID=A0ABV2LL12_9BACL|nr:DNA adenine methylase [Fictibacillus halophilus]
MEKNAGNLLNYIDSNVSSYDLLASEIQVFQSNYNITNREEYKNLVNFSTNQSEPYHSWFNYKEGYSTRLVENLLEKFGYKEGQYLLDPFSGSGTSLLTGKILGLNTVGFDVNPISVFITKAKTQDYNNDDILQIEQIIQKLNLEALYEKADKPNLSIIDKIFQEKQLNDLLKLKAFIANYEGVRIHYLLKLAYLSIIESVSNMKKDGNGIKYKKNPNPKDVELEYLVTLNKIKEDIKIAPIKKSESLTRVFHQSFIDIKKNEELLDVKYDFLITSPPYANCFDYCAVYKMELWMGDFVKDYKDFKKLRQMAIRSHVNGSVNPDMEHVYPLIKWISEEIDKFDLWDNKIPRMINGYFDDMTKSIKHFYALMKSGGKVAIVVANSAYKGYIVPTDLMLAYIAENAGFKVKEIGVCRSINTSSQQINQNKYLKQYMRESIILLEKK